MNSVLKSVTSEAISETVQLGFTSLASAAGLPTLALAAPLAKGVVLGLVEKCYNDCSARALSVRESNKLDQVSLFALQTFREFAERDGIDAWQLNVTDDYLKYGFEVAEHVSLEAIRQSESKKVEILGRYYGKQFYEGKTKWQDMHQMIVMTGELTLRQLVMIRLISDSFPGLDKDLYITNPSACVEIHRLLDFGVWQMQGAAFGINKAFCLRLSFLEPTSFAKMICDELMLDRLSEEDVKRTIDSLHLQKKGKDIDVLTREAYDERTEWGDLDAEGNRVIDAGEY